MNRLLRLAEYLFGAETRQRVFDPLVADAHDELGRRPPILLRLRWQVAMIVALVVSAPRAILIPGSLALDLALRSAAFASLAFVVQEFCASFERRSVPPSLLSILPFVIMPLAWRVRVSLVPHHQRRLVAILIGLIGAMLAVATAPAEPAARIAFALAPAIAVLIGWHMGDPAYEAKIQPHTNSIVIRGIMIGGVIQAFIWLPLLIAGRSEVDAYVPAVSTYVYPIGCAISASIVKRWHVDAQPQE